MTYAAKIVEKFGGVAVMAALIGKSKTTVQSWKDRGTIPDPHKPLVLKTAIENRIYITKEDFWPVRDTQEGMEE